MPTDLAQLLSESEERYRLLAEHSQQAVLICCDGRLAYANEVGAAFLAARGPGDIVGAEIISFVQAEARGLVLRILEDALSGGAIDRVDLHLTRYDGTLLEAEAAVAPVSYQGRPAVQLIARDVTERRQAVIALQESEQRFRRLTENAPDVIFRYRYTPSPGFDYVSAAATRVIGYTPDELYANPALGQPLVEPCDPSRPWDQATASGQPFVVRWVCGNGELVWTELHAVRIADEAGNVIAVEGIARDITRRVQTEEALARSRDFYLRLFDEFPTPIWRSDPEGHIDYCNRAWLNLTGRTADEAQGLGWLNSIHPDDQPRVAAIYAEQLRAHAPFEMQYRVRDASGEYRILVDSVRPFHDLDGSFGGYIASCHDITERERTGELLTFYAQRLATLNEIGRAILAARTAEGIAQAALEHIRQLIPCQQANVVVVDPLTGMGKVLASLASEQALPGSGALPETPGRCDVSWVEALRGERFTVMEDAHQRVAEFPLLGTLCAVGTTCAAILPLNLHGKLVGILILAAASRAAFAMEHMETAVEVADQLVLGLEHARLLQQVLDSQTRLRQLAQRVVTAQEAERRRVSRELHDEAGQALTALRISLELAQMELPPAGQAKLHRSLADAIALTESTMHQIRQLAQDLRPPVLDALGLGATLEDLCRSMERRTQKPVHFSSTQVSVVNDGDRVCLYRFVQEALTNVVKHACANEVWVTLAQEDDGLSVTVEDDGCGFDPAAVAPVPGQPAGLGLLGMRERVESQGGWLEIDASPGKGARLTAFVPAHG